MRKRRWWLVTYWLKHRPRTVTEPIVESIGARNEKRAGNKIIGRYSGMGKTAVVLNVVRFHPEAR